MLPFRGRARTKQGVPSISPRPWPLPTWSLRFWTTSQTSDPGPAKGAGGLGSIPPSSIDPWVWERDHPLQSLGTGSRATRMQTGDCTLQEAGVPSAVGVGQSWPAEAPVTAVVNAGDYHGYPRLEALTVKGRAGERCPLPALSHMAASASLANRRA